MSFLPYAVAAWLFLIGLYGIVSTRNLVCAILSLTVVQSATYVVLLAIGYTNGGQAPIFADIPQVTRRSTRSCRCSCSPTSLSRPR